MNLLYNPLFLLLTVTGLSFVIVAIITLKYPPKKINNIYGYRTKSSMKSDDRWEFSQKFSSALMLKYGSMLSIAGILALFTSFSEIVSVIIFSFLLLLVVSALFIQTEKAIKVKFGED